MYAGTRLRTSPGLRVPCPKRAPAGPAAAEDSERSLPLDTLLEQAERRLILHALKLAAGNKTRAAEILSIWRPRLLRRMEALGIEDPEK